MSAVFPHKAVVQRYLHTGPRRSSRKAMIAALLGCVACGAVVVTLQAGSPRSATPAVAGKAPVPVVVSDANAAAQPAPAAPVKVALRVDAPASATGQVPDRDSQVRPNPTPPNQAPSPVEAAAAPNPPPAPPAPAMQADAPQAPLPEQAAVPQAPAPEQAHAAAPEPAVRTPAAAPRKPVTSHRVAEKSTRKPTPKKVAQKAGTTHERAAQRIRTAHRQELRDKELRDERQRRLARGFGLPDGRRVYPRFGEGRSWDGDDRAPMRRAYLPPMNGFGFGFGDD